MATAKGICYVLNIPLIILNTLKLMAYATNKDILPSQLLCPMIDARRMEVFTGLYNTKLQELITPCAMILDNHSFADWLDNHPILFFGNGSQKFKTVVQHSNASFIDSVYEPQHMADLASEEFSRRSFADLAYAEPIYLKEFYSTGKLTG
jgi:tRNA threonylcarbamoyladenosine biosynthesis protein TsaB